MIAYETTYWTTLVNRAQTEAELAALRSSIQRGKPFGSDHWTKLTATRLASLFKPEGIMPALDTVPRTDH